MVGDISKKYRIRRYFVIKRRYRYIFDNIENFDTGHVVLKWDGLGFRMDFYG